MINLDFDTSLRELNPNYIVDFIESKPRFMRHEVIDKIVEMAKEANDPESTPQVYTTLVNNGYISDRTEMLTLFAHAAELGDQDSKEMRDMLFKKCRQNAIVSGAVILALSAASFFFWNKTFGVLLAVCSGLSLILGLDSSSASKSSIKKLNFADCCLDCCIPLGCYAFFAGLCFYLWDKIVLWWNAL